jgi:hypothetical protein
MNLKFNLNKLAKIHHIEDLPISEVQSLWKIYLEFLEKNENSDLDFPDHNLKFDQ